MKYIIIACLLMGCGTIGPYIGITGQLRVKNNTAYNAVVERQKCGSENWKKLGTVKRGKNKTWIFDEECLNLKATNIQGNMWYTRAYVKDGHRTTVFVVW